MLRPSAVALLAIAGLCISAHGQKCDLNTCPGTPDGKDRAVDFEASDDDSLLQVSRTQIPGNTMPQTVHDDSLLQVSQPYVLGNTIPRIVHYGETSGLTRDFSLVPSDPVLVAALRKKCTGFFGCNDFWHCASSTLALVSPFGLASLLVVCLFAWRFKLRQPPVKEVIKILKDSEPPVPETSPPPNGPQNVPEAPLRPKLEEGKRMSESLRWLTLSCNVLINVNFTVMMPLSYDVVEERGGGLALSGLLIGIYGLGTILFAPVMVYLSFHSYKAGFIATALCGILGNILYAVAADGGSVSMLLLARMVCGAEAAVCIMLANISMACTTGMARVQMVSELSSAGCLGLLLGPTLASVLAEIGDGNSADLTAAILMTSITTVWLAAVIMCCPGREVSLAIGMKNGPPPKKIITEPTGWLSLALVCASQFSRSFQRVFWESSFLFIIANGYGYGTVASGYLTALPLTLLLFLPLVGKFVIQRCGSKGYIDVMDTLQVFGIVLMFRLWFGELFKTTSAICFILGSSIFYFANWGQIVAIGPFQALFAVPGHPILNMETIPAWTWGCSFLGYTFGPIVARMIQATCPSQNALPFALLTSCLLSVAFQQIALELLKPQLPN